MPFRDVPPLRRPWWEELTGVWIAGTVVVGAAGALYPSSSLVSALGAGRLSVPRRRSPAWPGPLATAPTST